MDWHLETPYIMQVMVDYVGNQIQAVKLFLLYHNNENMYSKITDVLPTLITAETAAVTPDPQFPQP